MKAFIRRIILARGYPADANVVAEAVSRVLGRQDYHHQVEPGFAAPALYFR